MKGKASKNILSSDMNINSQRFNTDVTDVVANLTAEISNVKCPLSEPAQNKVKLLLLKIAGLFFVGLAIVGAILPILPTTVFLIIATACFAKSSPKMQRKLLRNKTFGPLIHDWQEHKSIPLKAKRIALLSIVLSVSWSSYLLNDLMLTALVIALVIWPVVFIWKLPLSK
jgi:uncharacterized membrane protein YbaN (DUF454 family)